jgi:hypothetical protein
LFRGAVNDMGTRLPSLARVGDPAADEERRGQDRSWAHVQARKTAQKGRHLTSAILAAIDGEAAESDALGDPSQVANARRELKDAHDGFYFAKYEADALFSERLWYQTMLSSPLVSTISTFAQAHLVPPERRAQLTSLADKFNEIGLRCLERIDAINVHFAQRAVPTMYGQAPPGSGGTTRSRARRRGRCPPSQPRSCRSPPRSSRRCAPTSTLDSTPTGMRGLRAQPRSATRYGAPSTRP